MNRSDVMMRLLRSRAGSIAVETAVSLSLLMVLSLGAFDIIRYYQLTGRVERVATTVADLVARGEAIIDRPAYDSSSGSSDTGTYFALAAMAARPERLDTEGGTVIAALTGTANQPTLHWSVGTGPLAQGRESRLAQLPSLPDGMPFILVEISLPFDTLILGKAGALAGMTAPTALRRRIIMRPRGGSLERLEPAP
jgi:Flp pilus assembly protein TadG